MTTDSEYNTYSTILLNCSDSLQNHIDYVENEFNHSKDYVSQRTEIQENTLNEEISKKENLLCEQREIEELNKIIKMRRKHLNSLMSIISDSNISQDKNNILVSESNLLYKLNSSLLHTYQLLKLDTSFYNVWINNEDKNTSHSILNISDEPINTKWCVYYTIGHCVCDFIKNELNNIVKDGSNSGIITLSKLWYPIIKPIFQSNFNLIDKFQNIQLDDTHIEIKRFNFLSTKDFLFYFIEYVLIELWSNSLNLIYIFNKFDNDQDIAYKNITEPVLNDIKLMNEISTIFHEFAEFENIKLVKMIKISLLKSNIPKEIISRIILNLRN